MRIVEIILQKTHYLTAVVGVPDHWSDRHVAEMLAGDQAEAQNVVAEAEDDWEGWIWDPIAVHSVSPVEGDPSDHPPDYTFPDEPAPVSPGQEALPI